MPKAKNSTNQDNLNSGSYEEKVAAIEKIITNIESGDLELADVFEQFTVAVEHLRQCETFLQQRQEQVDLLIETLKDD